MQAKQSNIGSGAFPKNINRANLIFVHFYIHFKCIFFSAAFFSESELIDSNLHGFSMSPRIGSLIMCAAIAGKFLFHILTWLLEVQIFGRF